MSFLKEFTDIHIELTDKCQASCPMCARNYSGGAERPFVGQHEITLEQFKTWFSIGELQHIKNFYACGNYGDPIIAQECLEIFQYLRESNPNMYLGIHTNGSARTTKWWQDLARVLNGPHTVTFAIDGFAESHVLYRRGTDWQRIIDNAKAFIQAGGYATVDCLVFEHNEDEVDEFKKQMLDMGFAQVNFKSTARFYDMDRFDVQDKQGNYEYSLRPAKKEPFKKVAIIKLEEVAANLKGWQQHVSAAPVNPKCLNKKEIYIDARGNVLPCCWVGMDWIEEPITETLTIHGLRNKMIQDSKDKFSKLDIFNVGQSNIRSRDWSNLADIVTGPNKPWTCVKNCHG